MKKLILAVLCLFPLVVFAADVQVQATANEPTTRTDASPLDNLETITFHYSFDGSTWLELATVPATSADGGGQAQTTATVTVPDNQQTTLYVTATATDSNGLVSAYADAAQTQLNLVRPNAPGNITIQVNVIIQ